MRQRGTFNEGSSSLQQDEQPLTMNELTVAEVYDFDYKYGQKSAWHFHEDLAAIDRSMMQNPKRNRRRFRKRRKYPKLRFVPSLEDIQENELFETQGELGNVKKKLSKDLATIHEERALGCGLPLHVEDGRRYRYKRYSRKSIRKLKDTR